MFFLKISPTTNQFNKGRLYNTAINYLQNQSLNITCLILHDVDLIPDNDGNFYTCESTRPKHTTSRVRQLNSTGSYYRYYEFLIGGVLLLTFDMYKTLNGFSNLYWGWGGEDDDLALRLIQQRMCVIRPNYELAIYTGKKNKSSLNILDVYFFIAFPHPRGSRNNARFSLLTWTTVRFKTDGYAQIKSLTQIIDIHQTSTVTHLKVDVNADGDLYKSSSMEKLSSSLSANVAHLTSSKKTIIRTRT